MKHEEVLINWKHSYKEEKTKHWKDDTMTPFHLLTATVTTFVQLFSSLNMHQSHGHFSTQTGATGD